MRIDPRAIRLDPEAAAPTPLEDVLRSIASGAVETMALLAEHRMTQPLRARASIEPRIGALREAALSVGATALDLARTAWEALDDLGYAWALWPAVTLSDGAVVDALEGRDGSSAKIVAGALAHLGDARARAIAEALFDHADAFQRAVAVEVLARTGALDAKRLDRAIADESPVVIAAALRVGEASSRIVAARAIELLHHDDTDLAFEAARRAMLLGVAAPLEEIRASSSLRSKLGARAIDLLAMGGTVADLELFTDLASAIRPTAGFLAAIGRFGCPLAWSFLAHHLPSAALGDAAEAALVTLFGPLPIPPERRDPEAWRRALIDRAFDPAARLCRGELWTPERVVTECVSGDVSAEHVAMRIDELRVRTGIARVVDADRWGDILSALGDDLAVFARADALPGTFSKSKKGTS